MIGSSFPDGYQYGVRFQDGSVANQWNGLTQRQHAADCRVRLAGLYPGDTFTLVRRLVGAPEWQAVE